MSMVDQLSFDLHVQLSDRSPVRTHILGPDLAAELRGGDEIVNRWFVGAFYVNSSVRPDKVT